MTDWFKLAFLTLSIPVLIYLLLSCAPPAPTQELKELKCDDSKQTKFVVAKLMACEKDLKETADSLAKERMEYQERVRAMEYQGYDYE